MADQRILYTEKMVGANHPTLPDTLNRMTLIEHATDGTHKFITDTTQSTSTSTGAIITAGGLGVAKNAHIGGDLTVTGHATLEGVTPTGATGSGKLVFDTIPTIASPTLSGHVTIEGVTTTGATGTGNVVFSTSPTLTSPSLGVATGTSFNSITGLSATTPSMDGSASVGTATTTARADHVHPSDTTKADKSGNLSQFAATTSTQLAGVISDETGSGALVFANTPTLVAPVLGTPNSGTLTNCTGLPISTGVSGLGTNVGAFLGTPTSANLAAAITDETGTGALVFANSPNLVTPNIGVASGTSFNSITALSSTLPSMDSVAAIGTSTTVARADHTHPSDTTKAAAADLSSHVGNTSNPHSVTATQVGLSNVENKSSATIRSEITSGNVTTALGFTPENVSNKSTSVSTDGSSDTKYPSVKAVKDYADGLVVGLLDYRGAYDASGNVFPSTGGSGSGGAVLKGDMWIISVAGTLGGVAIHVGDSVIAATDSPGQTAGNWNTLNGNISYVPANAATTISTSAPLSGGGDLSTNRTLSISQSTTSTDGYLSSTDWNTFNGKASTSGTLGQFAATTSSQLAGVISDETGSGSLVFNTSPTLSGVTLSDGTANGVLYLNGSKQVTSGSGLVFDSSGNLGIGTSSPGAKLEVKTAGSSFDGINVYSPSTTNGSRILFNNNYNSCYVGGIPVAATLGTDLVFGTTGSERMRLDSSGNLGLGVTPSAWYSSRLAMQLYNGGGIAGVSDGGIEIWGNSYLNSSGAGTYLINGGAALFQTNPGGSGAFKWYTASSGTAGNAITFTQAMTLDSSGNLLVGTTTVPSSNKFTVDYSSTARGIVTLTTATNFSVQCEFINGNGSVGSISTSGSSTSYNTSSDYRLKEDIRPVATPIARLNQLKPVNFAWKLNGGRCDGFLAHELQEVIPEAATGNKDEMRTEEYEVTPAIKDEEGNVITEAVMGEREVPVYQGIDQSKIVPLLTAALQEAVAKIESLTQRIEALEYTKQGE